MRTKSYSPEQIYNILKGVFLLKEKNFSKIKNKTALIGIIGMGYVGLPLAMEFARKGFQVVGFDTDINKVNDLNKKRNYIKHLDFANLPERNLISATNDMYKLMDMDVVLICVPTPLNKNREPDLKYVIEAAKNISTYFKRGQLISLESTTYPGTTEEVIYPLLSEFNHLRAGEDYFLAYSPEREDPGNKHFNVKNTPKIVGGMTKGCLEVATLLYQQIVNDVVPVSSLKVAEMTKILENTYRCVNIALVNELKMICDKMGIDIFEVIEAAKTKPFGFNAFYPGPGLGGHCIPIDPFYLTWKAKEYDVYTKFIELAGEINAQMPEYVVKRTMEELNDRGKTLKDSKILILGMAYKKDIDDDRETPAVKIIDLLIKRGAEVDYNDPFITYFIGGRHYPHIKIESINLSYETIKNYDCVILVTDHTDYSTDVYLKDIILSSNLIIDTRNVFDINLENVVRA
jgi:UDP-N-acetyl-D-glucosamine dehydrogenase